MSVAAVGRDYTLPDTPYNLWVRDELAERLHLPHDGTKVEVIGGEYVVSPGPDFAHNAIVQDVAHRVSAARIADPAFRWRCISTMDLDLSEIHDGYIPDLVILDKDVERKSRSAQLKHLRPEQVEMVLEVTSPSNASIDRLPSRSRSAATKWHGYAQVEIPYYLLIDRGPRRAQALLYSEPDRDNGYEHSTAWEFGETIRLPEPFGFEIPTDEWEPWA